MGSFMKSLSFGFDTAVIRAVNARMTQFTDYFGISGGDTGGGLGIATAMLYSIFTFGCLGGVLCGRIRSRSMGPTRWNGAPSSILTIRTRLLSVPRKHNHPCCTLYAYVVLPSQG
ncbi:hypothetical protein B0H15DRAFT_822314, partial [Mycena belliarum]